MVLLEKSFVVATVDRCHLDHADLRFMKSLNVKGYSALSHWVIDPSAKTISTPKESVIMLRPILELKGRSRKTLKFFLVNLDVLLQFIQSLNFVAD